MKKPAFLLAGLYSFYLLFLWCFIAFVDGTTLYIFLIIKFNGLLYGFSLLYSLLVLVDGTTLYIFINY